MLSQGFCRDSQENANASSPGRTRRSSRDCNFYRCLIVKERQTTDRPCQRQVVDAIHPDNAMALVEEAALADRESMHAFGCSDSHPAKKRRLNIVVTSSFNCFGVSTRVEMTGLEPVTSW